MVLSIYLWYWLISSSTWREAGFRTSFLPLLQDMFSTSSSGWAVKHVRKLLSAVAFLDQRAWVADGNGHKGDLVIRDEILTEKMLASLGTASLGIRPVQGAECWTWWFLKGLFQLEICCDAILEKYSWHLWSGARYLKNRNILRYYW